MAGLQSKRRTFERRFFERRIGCAPTRKLLILDRQLNNYHKCAMLAQVQVQGKLPPTTGKAYIMKKNLSLLCVLGCFVQPVWAANISTLGALTQPEFKLFSEDLGSALSYKAVTPPTPLGVTGFDLGLEATSTAVKNSQLWANASGGSSVSNLIVPKLHVYKGLPLNFDVGAFYSAVPSTNIKLYGGELRYAILDGGMALPAVGIRGSLTKLSGVDQLAFSTKSLDVSISKGFAMFTPYAGLGTVWVDSTPNVAPLVKETFRQNKIFAGGNLNFGLVNFAFEYDKTGSAPSYSAKLGFRF